MSGLSGDFRIVCSSVHTFNIFKQESASTKQGEKRSAPPGVPPRADLGGGVGGGGGRTPPLRVSDFFFCFKNTQKE